WVGVCWQGGLHGGAAGLLRMCTWDPGDPRHRGRTLTTAWYCRPTALLVPPGRVCAGPHVGRLRWGRTVGRARGGRRREMSDDRSRTELGALIAAHPWSRAEFVAHYNRVADELGESTSLSLRQLDRWIRGDLATGLPQSAARRVLRRIFALPAE